MKSIEEELSKDQYAEAVAHALAGKKEFWDQVEKLVFCTTEGWLDNYVRVCFKDGENQVFEMKLSR